MSCGVFLTRYRLRGVLRKIIFWRKTFLLLIDYPAYFSLLNIPLPDSRDGIMKALESDEMLLLGVNGQWNITNLGAILFAKDISKFSS